VCEEGEEAKEETKEEASMEIPDEAIGECFESTDCLTD